MPKDADFLLNLRRIEGLSQMALAKRLGFSQNAVSSAERGRTNISRRMLDALQREFPQHFQQDEQPKFPAWNPATIAFAVRVLTECGWLESHDKGITLDLVHRQQQRIPIIPEGWIAITERAPDKPGKYKAKGFTRAGRPYTGVAILYPDGNWYTLNGKRMPAPDCWQELAHNIQTVRY